MKTETQYNYYTIYDDLICRTTRTLKDTSLLEDMFNWFDGTCTPFPRKLKQNELYETAMIDIDRKDRKRVLTYVSPHDNTEFDMENYNPLYFNSVMGRQEVA